MGIMVEENKRNGIYPDMTCRVESAFHFPGVEAGVDIQQARHTESLANSFDSTLSTPPNSGQDANDGSFSFAKMLKQGASKPSTYAPLKSAAILGVVPQPRKNDDSEPEPEDYVPPPPKASLGDALAQAFVQAKTGNGNSAAANKPEVAKKSGKKGKKMKGSKDFPHRICSTHYGLKLIDRTNFELILDWFLSIIFNGAFLVRKELKV